MIKQILTSILLFLICTVSLSNGKDREKERTEYERRAICAKDGWVGFEEVGLAVCFFRVDENGDGRFITMSEGSITTKSVIRNLTVDSNCFKCDLINEKTGTRDGFLTGGTRARALDVITHTPAPKVDSRGIFRLVPVKDIQSVLKVAEMTSVLSTNKQDSPHEPHRQPQQKETESPTRADK